MTSAKTYLKVTRIDPKLAGIQKFTLSAREHTLILEVNF